MSAPTIVVGMSGGVDSSVAALLLKQQGVSVIGVFMKNWDDDATATYRTARGSACPWEEDAADVRRVCDLLDIPYLTIDFSADYRAEVFSIFLEDLKAGRTPNPDILCNQKIKFDAFLKKSLSLPGVTGIATGHYARISGSGLYRPVDRAKDQTYFLHRINPGVLPLVQFPLQDYTKAQVRALAIEAKLPTATKRDSTGICFIGDIDYRQFVREHITLTPGEIQTTTGQVVGQHDGLALYTIGQRDGLQITNGQGPYYVVAKQEASHTLIVTNQPDDPGLFRSSLRIRDLHWLTEVRLPLDCSVQIRYRQTGEPARLLPTDRPGELMIEFVAPQRAPASGQSAVFYKTDTYGKRVLGGGMIEL